jgi:16S rRNA (guanine(966)-N(2))-methyltransferase RsmD
MRIITGSAKGTKLKTPRGMETRPTADRVKESIFNIMGNIVIDAVVLDLFAGTGNLGLEALSRGADCAVFIDKSANSIEIIRENALHTKLIDKTEIYKNDVFKGLAKLEQSQREFDLIFCDPPYNKGFINMILAKIDDSNLLTSDGIIMMEHSQHETVKKEWKTLNLRRMEKYGETLVSFWCRIR